MLFTDGLQRDFVTEVVVGIIAILVLALLMDAILVLLERILTPWERAGRPGHRQPAAGPGDATDAARRLAEPKTGGGNA
jgi:osmoprotectant transport system permease protein